MQLRKNFRIGSDEGNVSGREYGGGSSSQGPAGGASAGGNYGGDSSGGVAPNQMSNTGRDNSITMENIGAVGIEDLAGDFAQFGPVRFGAAPNIYTPRSTGDIFDRFNRRQFVVGKPSITQRIGNAFDTLKGIPSAFKTASLQNLYDQKVGAKNAIPGFGNLFSVYDPALSTYEATDPSLDQYGMSGEDLTDIDRLASAIEKSKTQGITQKEFNDAFFGKDNPRNPNNITQTGGNGGGINTLQYMLPVAQAQEEIEEEPEEMSFLERLRQNLGLV